MSNGKLTGTEFRNEFLRSLNILAPRIARAIEIYGEDTVDVVNFTSSGTATLNNLSITGLTDIVSTATTDDVLDITADSLTTANVIDISADALTTGTILNLVSDSSDTSSRTLLKVLNDNSSATGTSAASFETHAVQTCVSINNDNTETNFGPIFTVNRKSSTVADDMGAGLINFQGLTDGGNLTGYARISAEASDVTDATPQGKLVLRAQLNIDASEPNAVEELMSLGGGVGADGAGAEVVINDLSYDVDFRVESNGETHMLFVDGGENRVSIGDSTDSPDATLEVTNNSSDSAPLVMLNNNVVGRVALDINAANETANVVDINADALTGNTVISVSADALTTGGILNLISDSSDTSARTLVTVKNDNTAAVGTVVMHLVNDAIGGFDDPILLIESTADETHPVLELKNSNASTTGEPIIVFTRSDTSAEADDMSLGTLIFRGVDADNNNEYYAQIKAFATDVTTGDEGGLMTFLVKADGTAGTAGNKTLFSIGGEDVANTVVPSVVVNEDGINCDFRVEGDTETHLIFADASVDRVSVGVSTDAPAATLEISNASDGGVPLVLLDSNDTDKICLDIDAANIDADVIDIAADAVTTAFVMDVTADALTTGGILNLVSDSSDNTARSLVKVHNDNTATSATHLLHLLNDARPDAHGEATALIESQNIGYGLELRYTGDDTGVSQMMIFTRTDTTGESDDDQIGIVGFNAVNSNNDMHIFAYIEGTASDVTDGDEGGLLQFFVAADGTAGTSGAKELFTIGGEDVANTVVPAVVVNEAGINCDFRVESDGEDEAIFLDASAETLYINKGESAFATQIHSTNDVAMTVGAAGVIFNEDGHATNDFRVESDAFSNMLFVDAGADAVQVVGSTAGLSICQDGFTVVNDFNHATFETKIVAGKHGSAEVLRYSPGADDTLTSGQLYFLHTDGTWNSTDADAVATGATQMLGVGLGDSARTLGCLIKGFISIPSTEILNLPGSGACDGLPLYVSTTAGHFDFTPPSGNNDFVRIVGYAIDDDSSNVLVYFNPDATHVEITA